MYSIGSFENYQDAKSVLQELTRAGIPEDEISFIANAEGADPAGGNVREVDISGVGHAIASGRLAETLQWDRDILDVLQQQGVQPERAQIHAENLRRGGALVLVQGAEQEVDEATGIMTDGGALNMNMRAEQWRQQGWERFDVHAGPARHEEKNRFFLMEEELHVGKRQQQSETEVRTRVEEQPVEREVRLREEHATVDEHKVDRPASEQEKQQAFKEQSFRVEETQERPVVEKQARVTGEVEIGKESTEHEETVKDTVRKTRLEVETKPRKK